ncbi:MAG: tyrosine-type recombinase/integrase [Thermodesulfobacteriota bacterium]
MGVTVRQKEKGKGKPWWVFICHQKKRKSIMVGDKWAAERLAAQIQLQLAAGNYSMDPPKQVPTFGNYARQWLNRYGEISLKPSTRKGYESILKNHLTSLADSPLDQITKADLRDLISAKLLTCKTPATVTRIKALISVIFSHAFDDDKIPLNPAIRLGKNFIRDKRREKTIKPLSREETQAFLASVQEHYPGHYPFFLCALSTGMRLGELLALEWGDIDFHGKFIEVQRAYVEGKIETPKSGKPRRVPMSDSLITTLESLRSDRKVQALRRGWGKVPDLVFVNEAGKIMNDGNLRRRVFYPALEKAGLRHIRIHDLRHTFASLLIQNGESLAYIRDWLGHHSIQITVDIYGHLEPEKNREAVERLDAVFLNTSEHKSGCVEGVSPCH